MNLLGSVFQSQLQSYYIRVARSAARLKKTFGKERIQYGVVDLIRMSNLSYFDGGVQYVILQLG